MTSDIFDDDTLKHNFKLVNLKASGCKILMLLFRINLSITTYFEIEGLNSFDWRMVNIIMIQMLKPRTKTSQKAIISNGVYSQVFRRYTTSAELLTIITTYNPILV